MEATRRTFRRPEPAEETRRASGEETRQTKDPAAAPAGKVFGKPALPAKPRGNLFYWTMRMVYAGGLGCAAYVAWAGVSDYRLYQRGQEFAHDVSAEQLTDPTQIWNRWAALSKDHPASVFLSGARAAAREKFIAAGDRVIATYRDSAGELSYDNWQFAHVMLLHALSTEPDDKAVHGKLRLVEGHIADVTRRNPSGINEAIREFQAAQQLMPQSPDPALALAHVYLTMRDADKAAAAFREADAKGYEMVDRDRSQLADGYRDRANRAWKDSFSVFGLPQEKDRIQQAANDYGRALELYQKSPGWGNSASRVAEMEASLESANTRLRQIALGDNQEEPEAARRNRFTGAIKGFIDGLLDKAAKDKSTKKDDQ
jgi:tetratricopeptide (TPR) repeat protein